VCLADIGIHEVQPEVLNVIARRSTAEGETIHNEPFTVTPEMVVDAIVAADAIGRDWKLSRSAGRSG
jgi:glycerol dehydrogenase